MKLADIKIGEKFIHDGKIYLRIDMNLSEMFPTSIYSELVCAVNLTTYRVVGLNKLYEVEPYSDSDLHE